MPVSTMQWCIETRIFNAKCNVRFPTTSLEKANCTIFHSPNPPPPFIKGVMKFFKNGCNWEDGKFLLKMVGKPGMRGEGVGFIIGGWNIFKVSLHSW